MLTLVIVFLGPPALLTVVVEVLAQHFFESPPPRRAQRVFLTFVTLCFVWVALLHLSYPS